MFFKNNVYIVSFTYRLVRVFHFSTVRTIGGVGMSEAFFHNFIEVVLTAFGILLFQLTFIVLGSRYGWFLWIGKRILQLRSAYLQKKMKADDRTNQED
jgi:hypothetical protein